MRSYSLIAAAAAAAALAGCVSYPVYQPVPVARLTPEQSAALASRPVTQADRDSYAAANAQVQREDQADQYAQSQAVVPYTYGYPVTPYYGYGGYYGYPGAYYGGVYPWYPSLSLSFGYRGGFGGYRGGHRGGWHGGGGGWHGGGGGWHGGGGHGGGGRGHR